jgi:hypothetical protein
MKSESILYVVRICLFAHLFMFSLFKKQTRDFQIERKTSSFLYIPISWDDRHLPSFETLVIVWDGVSLNFCTDWPWMIIFPICAFWVAEIVSMSHCVEFIPSVFETGSYIAQAGSRLLSLLPQCLVTSEHHHLSQWPQNIKHLYFLP